MPVFLSMSSAFLDSTSKWYAAFVFLHLTYFNQNNAFEVHPCCCKWQDILLPSGWIIFTHTHTTPSPSSLLTHLLTNTSIVSTWVWPLVKELRSHMLCSQKKRNKHLNNQKISMAPLQNLRNCLIIKSTTAKAGTLLLMGGVHDFHKERGGI